MLGRNPFTRKLSHLLACPSCGLRVAVGFGACRLTFLRYLDLSDTKVHGDISAISGCSGLTYLNLRWSKVSGSLSAIEGLPLTDLDLAGCAIKGDLQVISSLVETLKTCRLSRTQVKGNVGFVACCEQLVHCDLSKMAEVTGDIGAFEQCDKLESLAVLETDVDCDNLGALRSALKHCEIRAVAKMLVE